MADKNWKRIERAVGALLGLPKGKQRVGARGDSSFDVLAPIKVEGRDLGVEVKYRSAMPSCLFEWMGQAEGHKETAAAPADAIVVLVGYRKTTREYLALMPLEHYVRVRRAAQDGAE